MDTEGNNFASPAMPQASQSTTTNIFTIPVRDNSYTQNGLPRPSEPGLDSNNNNCQNGDTVYSEDDESRSSTDSPSTHCGWRRQILALVPLYLLQLSYGMSGSFPAVATAQLQENCEDGTGGTSLAIKTNLFTSGWPGGFGPSK